METKSESGGIEQLLQDCLSDSLEFFGDGFGPFSGSRGRTFDADAELERRGLGHGALGFGKTAKAGDEQKLSELVDDAENGDATAFEAAMRYVGNRLFQIDEFPPRLSFLAANILSGQMQRPPKRKAKDLGLGARNVAVFALVEIAKLDVSITFEQAFTLVAQLILKHGQNPNNAHTVKRIYLKTRARLGREISIHEMAVLASFPALSAVPKISNLLFIALGANR